MSSRVDTAPLRGLRMGLICIVIDQLRQQIPAPWKQFTEIALNYIHLIPTSYCAQEVHVASKAPRSLTRRTSRGESGKFFRKRGGLKVGDNKYMYLSRSGRPK